MSGEKVRVLHMLLRFAGNSLASLNPEAEMPKIATNTLNWR